MLSRHERQRLEQIEEQLTGDDPEFARRMQRRRWWWPWQRPSAPAAWGIVSLAAAVVCVLLGEASGFVTAAMLGAVLLMVRHWSFGGGAAE
ncbi:DUF3040 domain-containing protein [Bounagaea algeriensis]